MANPKIKITVAFTIEYEGRSTHYPEGSKTPEGMLAFDISQYEGDPGLILDCSSAETTVTGEIVK